MSLLAGGCPTTHSLLQLLTPRLEAISCQRHTLVTTISTLGRKQSQSYIATDGQSISKSWCRAPSGAHDPIFITL
jgi:hypothetical protein